MENSKMIPVRVSSWYSLNYNGIILGSLRKNDMYNNTNETNQLTTEFWMMQVQFSCMSQGLYNLWTLHPFPFEQKLTGYFVTKLDFF